MDMAGEVVHRWHYAFRDVWPDYAGDRERVDTGHWRRAHLYPNGDVLAVFNGMGLIKIDKESRLLWAYSGGCHHDISVAEDGTVWVLLEEEKIIPEINPELPVLEDFVVALDSAGRELRRVSLLECFRRSRYAALLGRLERQGDIFHTNTLEVFDGRLEGVSPLFAKGLALVSVRQLDTVAIVDLDEGVVRWALSGMWHMQHQPSLLPGGDDSLVRQPRVRREVEGC